MASLDLALKRLRSQRITPAAYRHRQLGLKRSDFVRSNDALVRDLEGGRHWTRDDSGTRFGRRASRRRASAWPTS